MSRASERGAGTLDLGAWPVRVAQMLDEEHMVAWSGSRSTRLRFAMGLVRHFRSMAGAEPVFLAGAGISDLGTFCEQLETVLPSSRPLARTLTGRGGVMERLRLGGARTVADVRHRFYVWLDADHLLLRDAALFGEIVDLMAGVAAEAEFASEDRLVVQRAVFVGAPVLDVYAEDPRGQFRRWVREGNEEPLWETVTGQVAPRFVRVRIERLGVPGPAALDAGHPAPCA